MIAEWHRARWVWNEAVGVLQRSGVWVSDKDLTRWRSEHAWLREGSVVAQQQELRNFRTKRARGKGRKRFKSVKRSRPSLNYTQRGFALSSEGRLLLPKGLSIAVVWSRELPSRPSTCGCTGMRLGIGTRVSWWWRPSVRRSPRRARRSVWIGVWRGWRSPRTRRTTWRTRATLNERRRGSRGTSGVWRGAARHPAGRLRVGTGAPSGWSLGSIGGLLVSGSMPRASGPSGSCVIMASSRSRTSGLPSWRSPAWRAQRLMVRSGSSNAPSSRLPSAVVGTSYSSTRSTRRWTAQPVMREPSGG